MKQLRLMVCMLALILAMPGLTTAQLQDFEFLRVDNINGGFSKLKLGNNPDSFWTGVDVTAGGNTHMEITFRVSEGVPNYDNIQIRPNGSSAGPVSFGSFVSGFTGRYNWKTIRIPLSAFDPSINFKGLYLIQIPYSANGGNFIFDLKSIKFTGGSTTYLWYGHNKRDNIHDGNGYNGQMVAYTMSDLYINPHMNHSRSEIPYNGEVGLAAIYQDQYGRDLDNSLFTWSDGFVGKVRANLAPGPYEVVFGPMDGAYDTLRFELQTLGEIEAETTYEPATATEDGSFTVKAKGGLVPYSYSDFEYRIKVTEAEKEFLSNEYIAGGSGFGAPNIIGQDHSSNYYSIETDMESDKTFLVKRNTNYFDIEWTQPVPYLFRIVKAYVDELGNTFVFSRTRNQDVIIGGKRFRAPNEAHVLVKYDTHGNIEWVKFLDDLLYGIETINFVEDEQGRFVWGMRKQDSKGMQTIMVSAGMNGNQLTERASSEYSGYKADAQYTDAMIVTKRNETFLLSYQSAGTRVDPSNPPVSEDGWHIHQWTNRMSPTSSRKVEGEYYRNSQTGLGNYMDNHMPIFEKWIPNGASGYIYEETYFLSYYGVFFRLRDDIIYGSEDKIYSRMPNGDLLMRGYVLDTLGTLPINYDQILYEDNLDRVYTYYFESYQVPQTIDRYLPVIHEQFTIPAGTSSFSFLLQDDIRNTFTFDSNESGARAPVATALDNTVSTGSPGLELYPNPAESEISFRFTEMAARNSLTLSDLSGRVVGRWEDLNTSGIIIQRNGLKAGVYLLTYEDQEKKVTERVIFK